MSQDFDDFYRATARRTVRYAYAITGDAGAAQDLTQEAYVRAWQRWSAISEYGQPDAWVRMVVTRLSGDRWRRIGVRRRFATGLRPPPPAEPPSEDTVMVTAALRRLPIRQRQAVALHYLMDMPIPDVAAELSVPVGTVKSWLSRGRAVLAEILTDSTIEGAHHGRGL